MSVDDRMLSVVFASWLYASFLLREVPGTPVKVQRAL